MNTPIAARRRFPSQSTAGFSLLELLLVLLLMAIVTGMAAPRWPGALLLSAQAERLAQDIRFAQALTLNQGQPHTLRAQGGSRYTLLDGNNQPLQTDPLSLDGVTIEPFSLSFVPPLAAPAASCPPIHLSMGGESVALMVSDLTGTVRIQP
ncbi:MAG: prepilin-type N-terminal cleavage/methylation domain-containing protein [Magnetococcales bacterium]|nr:prepilin-type N-terminal cleavage/methylation domain-containing protein [Magnetococcales bacterium]